MHVKAVAAVCIEVGAFGKEAYVLTGYLNVPKILEVTLNNGVDPVSGRKVGLETGDPRSFGSYDELYAAFMKQVRYFVDMKVRVSNYIDRMFAKYAPATFLSLHRRLHSERTGLLQLRSAL